MLRFSNAQLKRLPALASVTIICLLQERRTSLNQILHLNQSQDTNSRLEDDDFKMIEEIIFNF